MMHFTGTVVALCDPNRKTFREYDSNKIDDGRRAKVFIPFESEYQFIIKNKTGRRARLDIFIDGSLVTNNGLVISHGSTEYIERFLNSDKKFRFVKASHGAVADPTSPENGVIKVLVHKEKVVTITTITTVTHHHHHKYPVYPQYPYYPPWIQCSGGPIVRSAFTVSNSPTVNMGLTGDGGCVKGSNTIMDSNDVSVNYAATDGIASASIGEVGATIEGAHSNQMFRNTEWNGDDGAPICFTFYVAGVASEIDKARHEKLAQLERIKEELREMGEAV